jgi:hypothetical protein
MDIIKAFFLHAAGCIHGEILIYLMELLFCSAIFLVLYKDRHGITWYDPVKRQIA